MRFLFLTILIALVVFALVAVFIVPAEDRLAVATNIRNQISNNWRPVEFIERLIAVPVPQPESQMLQATNSVERISKLNGRAIGDWTYNCQASAATVEKCTLSQQIAGSDNVIVFSWLISIDTSGQFAAQWQTATGVMVNHGIILDAGTERPIGLPYSSCVSGYCQADADLADDFVDTLLKTTGATATVQPVTGPAVTYTISTRGLADGLRSLRDAVR